MASDVDVDAVAAAVRLRPPACGTVRVVAIDGGAASGKSTLAELLGVTLQAPVLHVDDMLDGWSGQFTYGPRLREHVLTPLAAGDPGTYRRYSWLRGRFVRTVPVPVTPILIIEGVGAISACRDAACYRIFLDVPRPERERRWAARDGSPLRPQWLSWLDAEEPFFAAHPPRADLVVRAAPGGDQDVAGQRG